MQKNRVKQSPISGAPREKTFVINYYSPEEAKRYQGTFTAKRPTVMQSMQIEGIKSSMLDGKYYDPRNPGCGVSVEMATLAEMLAFLKVVITNGPDWWEDGEGDFSDPGIVYDIYLEAQEVDPFRERFDSPTSEDKGREPEEVLGSDREASDEERGRADADDGLEEMVQP